MKRINVIGSSGSGKSTFSKKLAVKLNIDYHQMDQIYWLANWQEPTDEEFFAKLRPVVEQPSWVLDGNYNRTVPIKWDKVDTVVWLDYSFSRTLWQVITRTFKRSITREELWPNTGNRESFYKALFSKDSIIWWMISNYKRNQRRYHTVMNSDKYGHIRFVRLRSPKQAEVFLNQL